MTKMMRSTAQAVAAASMMMAALAVPASAGSMKDEPVAEEGRKLTWSFNIGGTSDYVFRGISQTQEDPTLQGGVDIGYGIFYAGVWGSGVDFVPGTGPGDASVEVDFYAGIKPVWGPLTFDLGVIYYAYPSAKDAAAELDYVEIKGGVSGSIQSLSLGGTVFYSPDYTGELGSTWTLEGTAGYTLPAVGPLTPTISALIGTTLFDDNSALDYVYWNAGIAFAVEKFTFDFRYWDTNSDGADFCAVQSLCDERFVFTAKVTLP